MIDRIGPIHLQEIPNEIEGPRFIYYRGPLGRISLEPAAEGPRKGEWLFTAETVAQVEPMFLAMLRATGTRHYGLIWQDPITFGEPAAA